MDHRRLGRTELVLSPVGFGAFKLGRNEGIKYARAYDLPGEDEVARLLAGVLDLGINYIDTAPAYGLSEERIGRLLPASSAPPLVSTKVGETFENGRSTYDFSTAAVRESIDRSCRRLRRDPLDLVFVHSDGDDLHVLEQTDVVETLVSLREAGRVRAIGFSGKTTEGATAALAWCDALMVAYHLEDRSHERVIAAARDAGVGVVVKKGLASGHLDAERAIRFVLDNDGVTSVVVGGLSLEHVRANVAAASMGTT